MTIIGFLCAGVGKPTPDPRHRGSSPPARQLENSCIHVETQYLVLWPESSNRRANPRETRHSWCPPFRMCVRSGDRSSGAAKHVDREADFCGVDPPGVRCWRSGQQPDSGPQAPRFNPNAMQHDVVIHG